MIHVTGTLTCATAADAALVRAHLPEHWRGVLFILGLLPLIVMGWAYLQYQEGLRQESNLAPIFFFLAAPPCGLWLVILSLFRR